MTVAEILKAVGVDADRAERMASAFAARVADVASFHNCSADDAERHMRNALLGEWDGARQFGVDLTSIELTHPPYRVLLAYDLILDQTARAAGDRDLIGGTR